MENNSLEQREIEFKNGGLCELESFHCGCDEPKYSGGLCCKHVTICGLEGCDVLVRESNSTPMLCYVYGFAMSLKFYFCSEEHAVQKHIKALIDDCEGTNYYDTISEIERWKVSGKISNRRADLIISGLESHNKKLANQANSGG